MLAAEGDAGEPRHIFPVGGGEQLGGVAFDRDRDVVHALAVGCGRVGRRRALPVLDRSGEPFEFGSEIWVAVECCLVAPVVVADVVGVAADAGGDGVPRRHARCVGGGGRRAVVPG